MESKEWTLGKQPAHPKIKQGCLAKHPVWQILIKNADLESPDDIQALRRCAQTLLSRGGRGVHGSSPTVLRLVLFVVQPSGWQPPESLLQHRPQADESDEPMVISTSPTKPAPQATSFFNVLLIFDGDGRPKQTVKHSVQALLDTFFPKATHAMLVEAALASLEYVPLLTVLRLVAAPRVHVYPDWKADTPPTDVTTYLARRVNGPSGAGFNAENAAVMATLGLDMLGPRPKQKLPQHPQLSQKRLKGPEPNSTPLDGAPPSDAAGPSGSSSVEGGGAAASASSSVEGGGAAASAAPTPDALADLLKLLQFDGELTQAVAADRAAALMSAFHQQADELCRTKLRLNYYEERDRLEATVRPCFKICSCCETHCAVCSCAAQVSVAAPDANAHVPEHVRRTRGGPQSKGE